MLSKAKKRKRTYLARLDPSGDEESQKVEPRKLFAKKIKTERLSPGDNNESPVAFTPSSPIYIPNESLPPPQVKSEVKQEFAVPKNPDKRRKATGHYLNSFRGYAMPTVYTEDWRGPAPAPSEGPRLTQWRCQCMFEEGLSAWKRLSQETLELIGRAKNDNTQMKYSSMVKKLRELTDMLRASHDEHVKYYLLAQRKMATEMLRHAEVNVQSSEGDPLPAGPYSRWSALKNKAPKK